ALERNLPTYNGSERFSQFVDGCLRLAAHIDPRSVATVEREDIRPGDVLHVNEVAGLLAVSVHLDRFAPNDAVRKDGDDAPLPVGVLSWPVHVGVAQDGEVEAVQVSVNAQVLFDAVLGDPVR